MSSHATAPEHALRGNPAAARQFNDRVALELFAHHGRLSRTQIRDMMGVAQPTAIDIIRRLERAELIEPAGEERQTRPGPKAALYGLVYGRWFVVGANIRDRKISAAVGDVAGGPALEIVSRAFDRRPMVDQVADAIDASLAQAGIQPDRLDRAVIGVPGIVNVATGDLGFSWDLPRLEGRFLAPLRQRITTPLRLLNGVQLAAFAEGQVGDLRKRQTFALIWVGTGVGSCLMVNGTPLLGASGAAGQIGYTPVPGSPILPIQQQTGGFEGDLQGLIGARGLRALAKDMGLRTTSPGTLLRMAASSRDAQLHRYLTETARRIAVACASIASVVDPGTFVLQGATALAGGATLASRVEDEFKMMSPLEATVVAGRHTENVELEGALQLGRALAREQRWGGVGVQFRLPDSVEVAE